MTKIVYTGDKYNPFVTEKEWKAMGGNLEEGTKYDNEKPRMDLLDADFLEGVAEVLTFGANKYAAHNWRKGINVSRLIAATYRHLGAINKGEDVDKESNLPHVYHASCCLMFLANMLNTRPDLDDRWKPK